MSVFDLMRDGRELSMALSGAAGDERALAEVVRPYLQPVLPGARCEHTGLLLGDVWRYFRHTWANPYKSTPGRGLAFLVRDAAAPAHPVVGVAMLGSTASQISVRDEWIGWTTPSVVQECHERPSAALARWVVTTLDEELRGVMVDDLLADGVVSPADLLSPGEGAVQRLRAEAVARRDEHRRFVDTALAKRAPASAPGPEDDDGEVATDWASRAREPLFRSKRAALLAELLAARAALLDGGALTPERLGALAATTAGQRALGTVARRSKARRMGVAIAEITVCGAVSPYRELLGGKLVALLMMSPEVRRTWEDRYAGAASVIASSMAGRAVRKDSTLALLMTTSLYGVGSSQYNRVRLPIGELGLGRGELRYRVLGVTAGFGSSQFAEDTVEALSALTSQAGGGLRVHSIFGEGVSPRLRKVREGLDLLELPSDRLLRHGSSRVVYAVELGEASRPWLRGLAEDPELWDPPGDPRAVTEAIVAFWRRRWLAPRTTRQEILDAVAVHTLARPVHHGARVELPDEDQQASLFDA